GHMIGPGIPSGPGPQGMGPQGMGHPGMQPGMGGATSRLVLAGIGLLIATVGLGVLGAAFVDRNPERDLISLAALIGAGGMLFTGIGIIGKGKYTSGLAPIAGIFTIIGALGYGLVAYAVQDGGSDIFFYFNLGMAAGSFAIFWLGLWAVTSGKGLGVLAMICGVFILLSGHGGSGFWVMVLAEALKLSHVHEIIPAFAGGSPLWTLI